jgi:hypothetical protein
MRFLYISKGAVRLYSAGREKMSKELLLIDDKKATFVVQLFTLANQQVETWVIAENVENVSFKNEEDKHTRYESKLLVVCFCFSIDLVICLLRHNINANVQEFNLLFSLYLFI